LIYAYFEIKLKSTARTVGNLRMMTADYREISVADIGILEG